MTNIVLEHNIGPAMDAQYLEIVERKGLGHPDTICDAIVDEVSVKLSQEYLKRFGTVLHHNIDKAFLVAGKSEPEFGGGVITEPIRLIYGDRATAKVGDEEINVRKISNMAVDNWVKKHLPNSPLYHIVPECVLQEGSGDLKDIFNRKNGKYLGANDTSAAVGYAPLSRVERTVIDLENHLNSKEFKKEFPASGHDIKIMATRIGKRVEFTIAMAMIDEFVYSERDYFVLKEQIEDEIVKYLRDLPTMKGYSGEVTLNALDRRGRGKNGCYLTVSGTSAESGDSGQVGRGNNPAGIIALSRPASAEAAAGKNPVSHVGKIYNAFAFHLAEKLYEKLGKTTEFYVWIVSRIGQSIDKPLVVGIKCTSIFQDDFEEDEIRAVVEAEFKDLDKFVARLSRGEIKVY